MVYLWSGPHAVASEEPLWEGDNHHFFPPHMTLLNCTILHQPLLIQTGALMSLVPNSRVQMAAVGEDKTQESLTVGLETYSSMKKTISEAHGTMEVQYTQNYQFRVENYWTFLCLTPGLYSNHNEF